MDMTVPGIVSRIHLERFNGEAALKVATDFVGARLELRGRGPYNIDNLEVSGEGSERTILHRVVVDEIVLSGRVIPYTTDSGELILFTKAFDGALIQAKVEKTK